MRGAPSSIAKRSTTGRLQLGVTSLVAGYVLSDLLARYRRAHPAVEISAIEDDGDYLEHLLVGGKLDIAVMVTSNLRDRMALQSEILEISAYRLWLPLGHPLAAAEIINLGDIAAEPLIMLTVDEIEENTGKLLDALGARPHVAFRTRSVEAVRSLVATGAGVALLPDLVYRPWSLEGDRIESPRHLRLAAGRPGRHGLAARFRPAAGGARFHRHRSGAAYGASLALRTRAGPQTSSALNGAIGAASKRPAPASLTARRNVGHSIGRSAGHLAACRNPSRIAVRRWMVRSNSLRLCVETSTVHPRQSVGRQHCGNLVQREAAGPSERDQGEPFQHGRIEEAAQAAPADRSDEALFLVIAQRRGRHAGPARYLDNIQIFHA